jgi:chromosome partitioning protein
MSVASTTVNPVQKQAQGAFTEITDLWLNTPGDCSEIDLGTNLLLPILDKLGISIEQRKQQTAIHKPDKPGKSGLKPDFLVYRDIEEPPVLVVEIKRRTTSIHRLLESDFEARCKKQALYKQAIGYDGSPGNGIKQYLDPANVKPEFLAPYGLVFNGDFFQLWRRVDGLIFPMTPIEKFTEENLPRLLRQLENCLQQKPPALIASVWNRKGGVAKTTNLINIAATLALSSTPSKRRVLLIDLDPQGDLAGGIGCRNLNNDREQIVKIFDRLELLPKTSKTNKDKQERHDVKELLAQIIRSESFKTKDSKAFELSIISLDRQTLEGFRDAKDQGTIQSFSMIVELLKSDYDYIFIDAAPVLDLLAECMLMICDVVLLSVDEGSESLQHAVEIDRDEITLKRRKTERYEKNKSYGPWSLGIVRSNWTTSADSKNSFEDRASKSNFSKRIYKTCIKKYASAAIKATDEKLPVVCWQKSSLTKLYSELVQEVFLSANFIDQ